MSKLSRECRLLHVALYVCLCLCSSVSLCLSVCLYVQLHDQGTTLSCLSNHLDDLSTQCGHELLRVAELQADDYHKDRQLFLACRDDRETFCHDVRAGSGAVYKCLYKHKFDLQMTPPVCMSVYVYVRLSISGSLSLSVCLSVCLCESGAKTICL